MSRIIILVSFVSAVNCANILAVVPTVSRSHYVGFNVIIDELIKRGHRVTCITTFPRKVPVENLREIDVKKFKQRVAFNDWTLDMVQTEDEFFSMIPIFIEYVVDTGNMFKSPQVSKLISSDEKFDLIILETFLEDLFSGFAYRFDAPVLAFSSCSMFPWVVDRFGIPEETSYMPSHFSGYGRNMNFFQRVRNVFLDVSGRLFYKYWLEPLATEISRSIFGQKSPAVRDLVKNASLYMVNTHWSLYGARPLPPQVVDVSGIHLRPARPLQLVE